MLGKGPLTSSLCSGTFSEYQLVPFLGIPGSRTWQLVLVNGTFFNASRARMCKGLGSGDLCYQWGWLWELLDDRGRLRRHLDKKRKWSQCRFCPVFPRSDDPYRLLDNPWCFSSRCWKRYLVDARETSTVVPILSPSWCRRLWQLLQKVLLLQNQVISLKKVWSQKGWQCYCIHQTK